MLNVFILRLLENSAVISAAIILLYIMSRVLRGKTPPRVRLVCWLVIAAGLLLPVRPVLYTVTLPEGVAVPAAVQAAFDRLAVYAPATAIEESASVPEAPPARTDADVAGNTEITTVALAPISPESSGKLAAELFRELFNWQNALAVIWGLGALAFLLTCTVRHRRFARNIRRWSHPAQEPGLTDLLDEVCRAVRLRRRVRLLICPLVTTPVMMGLLRPVFILPDEHIEPERLRLMLMHEALHCKHGHIWAKALSLLAMAAHWFNPLVWLMNKNIITETELSCDAAVLRHAGEDQRLNYGETVLSAARRGREVTLLASAFSGGGKNLKRRLRDIVEHSKPKRWIAIVCAAAMLCGLLVTGLVSCKPGSSGGIDPIPQSPIDLTPTDELVIYVPGNPWLRGDLEVAIGAYKRKYPEIKLIVEEVGDPDGDWGEQYRERVNSEMLAGKGPDVILANPLFFYDLYKTMDTGAFLNLASIFDEDEDESFVRDDLNMAVLDAGVYKGGRYIIPYNYNLSILTALPDKLYAAGFDSSKSTDFVSFFNELSACLSNMGEAPMFQRGIGLYEYFDGFEYAGLRLIDYERKTVLPDEAAFKAFCEAMKPYFQNGYLEKPYDGSTRMEALLIGNSLFDCDCANMNSYLWGIAEAKTNGENATLSAVPSIDGGLTAVMAKALAIRAGSPNQLNAWNFIKLMLDEKVQKDQSNGGSAMLPVNNKTLRTYIEGAYLKDFNGGYGTVYGGKLVYLSALTPEEKQPLLDICSSVTDCVIPIWTYSFYEYMTPYFNDKKSYDECVATLKSRLTLYVSE